MDLGEQLTALENHIYVFAKTQFEINSIPPTTGRLIMESVYSKFQDQAIAQMIANQVSVEGGEEMQTEKKTGSVLDMMKDFYNTGFHPDNEEGENGGTEDSTAQA